LRRAYADRHGQRKLRVRHQGLPADFRCGVADSDEIGCTLGIIHRFVKNLAPGNTNCVRKIRPVRTVPRFARTASELAPLQPRKGDKTTDAQRRIAAAGLETVGDVIARYYVTFNYIDSGLRGGRLTYAATDAGYDFKLEGFKWTEDIAVSGTVSWDQTSNIITAQVTLKIGGTQVGSLQVSWNDADIDALASVKGEIQGATLIAQRIAP
jgi:hypothetical protein